MELPEVECVFDMSRNIYCLKPKGSHVGLSGNEIKEATHRCNCHEKFKIAYAKAYEGLCTNDLDACDEAIKLLDEVMKEAEMQ